MILKWDDSVTMITVLRFGGHTTLPLPLWGSLQSVVVCFFFSLRIILKIKHSLFTSQILIQCQLHEKHCPRPWGHHWEQNGTGPGPHKTFRLTCGLKPWVDLWDYLVVKVNLEVERILMIPGLLKILKAGRARKDDIF